MKESRITLFVVAFAGLLSLAVLATWLSGCAALEGAKAAPKAAQRDPGAAVRVVCNGAAGLLDAALARVRADYNAEIDARAAECPPGPSRATCREYAIAGARARVASHVAAHERAKEAQHACERAIDAGEGAEAALGHARAMVAALAAAVAPEQAP